MTEIFQISMFLYFRLVLLIQYFLFIISVVILSSTHIYGSYHDGNLSILHKFLKQEFYL